MEPFGEAPIGAIIIVVLGAALVVIVSPLAFVVESRRHAAYAAQRQQGVPSPAVKNRAMPVLIAVDLVGTALFLIGLAIWSFG